MTTDDSVRWPDKVTQLRDNIARLSSWSRKFDERVYVTLTLEGLEALLKRVRADHIESMHHKKPIDVKD